MSGMHEFHVATGRHVVTYEPDGLPAGVITGYVDEMGGFVVEHVMTFRRNVLRPKIRTALRGPWPFAYAVLHINERHHRCTNLQSLARWAGFVEYAPTWWVMYPTLATATAGKES